MENQDNDILENVRYKEERKESVRDKIADIKMMNALYATNPKLIWRDLCDAKIERLTKQVYMTSNSHVGKLMFAIGIEEQHSMGIRSSKDDTNASAPLKEQLMELMDERKRLPELSDSDALELYRRVRLDEVSVLNDGESRKKLTEFYILANDTELIESAQVSNNLRLKDLYENLHHLERATTYLQPVGEYTRQTDLERAAELKEKTVLTEPTVQRKRSASI